MSEEKQNKNNPIIRFQRPLEEPFVLLEGGSLDEFEASLRLLVSDAPVLLASIRSELEAKGFRWQGKLKTAVKNMVSVVVVGDGHPQPVDYLALRDKKTEVEYLSRGKGFVLTGERNSSGYVKRVEKGDLSNAVDADLFRFAFIPDCRLEELREMALPENWTVSKNQPYGVLKNYLKYTFQRAVETKAEAVKILTGRCAVFNTGLVNADYEWIYAYFEPNRIPDAQPWCLTGFFSAGDRGAKGIGKKAVVTIGRMPGRVEWLNRNHLYFDVHRQVYLDFDHIVLQRIERIPSALVRRYADPDSALGHLYDQITQVENLADKMFDDISKTVAEYAQNEEVGFERYKMSSLSIWDIEKIKAIVSDQDELAKKIADFQNINQKSHELYDEVKRILCGDEGKNVRFELKARIEIAKKLAQKKVSWDYATAVPVYYPTTRMFGFLLPLCLLDTEKVDVVLVVSDGGEGTYQGQTILTPEMAYCNARLLRRPDAQWIHDVVQCQ